MDQDGRSTTSKVRARAALPVVGDQTLTARLSSGRRTDPCRQRPGTVVGWTTINSWRSDRAPTKRGAVSRNVCRYYTVTRNSDDDDDDDGDDDNILPLF